MALRTARQGPNQGNRFWGCTLYPDCTGLRNINDQPEPAETDSSEPDSSPAAAFPPPASLPVAWTETAYRRDFIPEYISVGALPGVFRERLSGNVKLERSLSQCVLLTRRSRPRQAAGHARLASALLVKLLQRGRTPLPTLKIEREALRKRGFLNAVCDLAADGAAMGWELRPGARPRLDADAVVAALANKDRFILDPAFDFNPDSEDTMLQSAAESRFLNEWTPKALGPAAGHWFTPQAPLDKLLESRGADEKGARRIDFLFHHPGGLPLAIEIDGADHASAAQVDAARDAALQAIGIEVVRVPNEEVMQGRGAALDRVRSHCNRALTAFDSASADKQSAALVGDCAVAAKVQFALARAVGFGWLTAGREWAIHLRGAGAAAAAGVLDALRLLAGFDVLYGESSTPTRCTVRTGGGPAVTWVRGAGGEWVETVDAEAKGEIVRIAIESAASPFHRASHGEQADFVIRPAFLPVEFAAEHTADFGRRDIAPTTYSDARPTLRVFLQSVFRKREFRSMQGEAVFNALRRNDCAVLLPTGAGKSIIYQLAGLLMPGVTLVVDPLIALLEDQVEGLRAYGIDRAAAISSNLAREERRRLLIRVERGEYQFVLHPPERLQSPQFRGSLQSLSVSSLVNLAVIDEAHCVSEWGHDFRPAYLGLAGNLRRFGVDKEGLPPPVLALTGTASRAVLRDMLVELGIDRNRSDALIRPDSFDRPELCFEIVRTSPTEDPQAKLRGALHALPGKFSLPRAEFYRSAGHNTQSGIVFVPTVNARPYGLREARHIAQRATGAEVAVYSGSPPDPMDRDEWDAAKKENAALFKRNRAPVLVATKAFGMGIDKPNIRYTVHFGMPSSLESFYQEAGRAGRDRKPARCIVVFSEYDRDRSDKLLDPDIDLDALRKLSEEENRNIAESDDVTRSLWFHLQAFAGMEREIDDVDRVLKEIGDLSVQRSVKLPLREKDDGRRKEKAICRLLKIGAIQDYEVDYGRQLLHVHTRAFDLDRCKQCLLEYVHAAQPAMGKLFAQQVAKLDSGAPHGNALALARMFIAFVYDVVERSRRRMIQESVLLARQAESDNEIRGRLLDYLQEGLGAERIGSLLDSEEIDLPAWWELVEKAQTPMDAGELRGLSIRALESYPDHPGLLLIRAAAESMCSDRDEDVISRGIGAAIRTGIEKYGLAQTEVEAVIDALFALATTRAPDLGPPLVYALLFIDLDESNPGLAFASKQGLKMAGEINAPLAQAAVTTRKLHGVAGILATAVERVVPRYEAMPVKQTLQALQRRLT